MAVREDTQQDATPRSEGIPDRLLCHCGRVFVGRLNSELQLPSYYAVGQDGAVPNGQAIFYRYIDAA